VKCLSSGVALLVVGPVGGWMGMLLENWYQEPWFQRLPLLEAGWAMTDVVLGAE
jgi:hypothetical protein